MAATTRKDARTTGQSKQPASSSVTRTGSTGEVTPETEIKHFVLDTNVLLHNPNALFVFKEHHVVIPCSVIE